MFTFYSWRQIASVIRFGSRRTDSLLSLCLSHTPLSLNSQKDRIGIHSWIYSGSARYSCIIHHSETILFTKVGTLSE